MYWSEFDDKAQVLTKVSVKVKSLDVHNNEYTNTHDH